MADDHDFEGTIICTIVENRSREICVCKINMSLLSAVEIFVLSDCHSYVETSMLLESINPHEILLRDGSTESALSKKIAQFVASSNEHARVLYISRQYFDQDRGAELLKKVSAGPIDADIIAKYVVLAGCFCLLRYVENITGNSFTHHSLRLCIGMEMTARMIIDRRTAINLELISNSRTGKQKDSVFGVINLTRTVVGARFLRSTLLRPLASVLAIEMRLDMVEQLVKNRMSYCDIVDTLMKFPDLDKMLSGIAMTSRSLNATVVKDGIDTLIYLKHSLRLAASLAAALQEIENGHTIVTEPSIHTNASTAVAALLVTSIKNNFIRPEYAEILLGIDDLLSESTAYSKNTHEMRHQECFAVHSGVNSFLDLARATFLQCVEDIYELAQTYNDTLDVDVKVTYNASRGYFLQVQLRHASQLLPSEFIQPVQNKRSISATTEAILSLSDRAREAIDTALRLSNSLIQELLVAVRRFSDHLFVFVDSVALIDMLCSFAELVGSSKVSYSRPVVQECGPLVVQEGRHVIMSALKEKHTSYYGVFVSNDTYISNLENFHVVTGCNGAGKSTYIKQVALLVVLAQVGCFVPAKNAVIPIRDRLLSRIGTSDDMEHNLSTFHTEMKECSYILDNLTVNSLVIIDELGRGTSNIDGFSIAMAVAEALVSSDAFSLFVTHFNQITTLETIYPNVRNIHLNGELGDLESVTTVGTTEGIQFVHKLGAGPCVQKIGYGIEMAKKCGIPDIILEDALEIQDTLRPLNAILFEGGAVDQRISVLLSLLENLLILKQSTLSAAGLKTYLGNLFSKLEEYAPELQRALKELDVEQDDSLVIISNENSSSIDQESKQSHGTFHLPVVRQESSDADSGNQIHSINTSPSAREQAVLVPPPVLDLSSLDEVGDDEYDQAISLHEFDSRSKREACTVSNVELEKLHETEKDVVVDYLETLSHQDIEHVDKKLIQICAADDVLIEADEDWVRSDQNPSRGQDIPPSSCLSQDQQSPIHITKKPKLMVSDTKTSSYSCNNNSNNNCNNWRGTTTNARLLKHPFPGDLTTTLTTTTKISTSYPPLQLILMDSRSPDPEQEESQDINTAPPIICNNKGATITDDESVAITVNKENAVGMLGLPRQHNDIHENHDDSYLKFEDFL